MDQSTNILLLSGGGGSEHEISQISAKHILNSLKDKYEIIHLEMGKDGTYTCLDNNSTATFASDGELDIDGKYWDYHFVIPCFHGYPGESGEIASFFELIGKNYLGQKCEQSTMCFNKITTKLWLSALNINNSPYEIIVDASDTKKAFEKFNEWGSCFIKASNQGSSVGCYKVTNQKDLASTIRSAFTYSEFVLIEKAISGRELEVSVYEYNGKIEVSTPGEIVLPDSGFYSYEEKYSDSSKTETAVTAKDLPSDTVSKIKDIALKAFKGLKLRHLSRIDFFYTDEGEILINEINTFPGLTPISMFPKMMEANGHSFTKFLSDIIEANKQE